MNCPLPCRRQLSLAAVLWFGRNYPERRRIAHRENRRAPDALRDKTQRTLAGVSSAYARKFELDYDASPGSWSTIPSFVEASLPALRRAVGEPIRRRSAQRMGGEDFSFTDRSCLGFLPTRLRQQGQGHRRGKGHTPTFDMTRNVSRLA